MARLYLAIVLLMSASAIAESIRDDKSFMMDFRAVPPVINDDCILGPWRPQRLPCAQCFCFFNRLSRCLPVMGCDPSSATTTTTTTVKPNQRPPFRPRPTMGMKPVSTTTEGSGNMMESSTTMEDVDMVESVDMGEPSSTMIIFSA